MSTMLPKGLFADPKGGLANILDSRPMPPWIEEPIHFEPHRPRLVFRTVWISDTHLGTPGCNSELLLDFLKGIECETLYLVGDIIDGWQLRKGLVLAAAAQRHRPLRAEDGQARDAHRLRSRQS